MHKLSVVLFTLALTAGCTPLADSRSANAPIDSSAFAAGTQCDANDVQSYIGQSWHDALAADLRRVSSSQTLRTLKPGQVITLELNPYRLNALIDAQNKITSLYCG